MADDRGTPPAWTQHRAAGGALNVLAVIGIVGGYVVSAQAGVETGTTRATLLSAGAACAALVFLLGALIQYRDRARIRTAKQAAIEAQEQLTITLNGALAPITSYLGEMGSATDPAARAQIGGKLRQAVVDAVVRLTGPTTRASFYRFDPAQRRLVLDVYGGRSTLPRDQFTTGTDFGDVLIDLVERCDLVFLPDIERDRLITPTNPGDYATVIATAVTAGPQALGLLTVDAARVGELTHTHVELIRVFANLLGSGLVQQ